MDAQHSLKSSLLGSTPHPSSPISGASASTPPRLGGALSRKLRPSSSAGSPVLSATNEQISVQSRNAEAVKTAKQFLLSNIRSDWDYDPSSPPTQSDLTPLRLENVDYRRREDGSSDPGSGSEDMRDPMAWTDGELDPYKYESPDAVATALLQKKRKRRRLLQEEMQYNEGLRVFHARRNAWTGAVTERIKRRAGQQGEPPDKKKKHSRNNSLNLTFDFELGMTPDRSGTPSPASVSSPPSMMSDVREGTPEPSGHHPVHPSPDIDVDPLIPIAPPLIPQSNPVRAAITPSMYPTIYSKIVIQSLTPSVPIPLPDMARAMVQGWKEEGNWPPKANANMPPSNATILNEVNGRHNVRKDISSMGLRANVSPGSIGSKDKDKKDGGGSGSMRKGMSGAFRKALGSWRTNPSHASGTASGGSAAASNATSAALITGGGSGPRAAALGGSPGKGISESNCNRPPASPYADPGNAPDTEDADAMFEYQ